MLISFRFASVFILLVTAVIHTCGAQERVDQKNSTHTQPNYPPEMDEATSEIYKKVGDANLNIYIF